MEEGWKVHFLLKWYVTKRRRFTVLISSPLLFEMFRCFCGHSVTASHHRRGGHADLQCANVSKELVKQYEHGQFDSGCEIKMDQTEHPSL